jgi:hypothetical protein
MVDPAFAEYATHIARNQNFILLHSTLNIYHKENGDEAQKFYAAGKGNASFCGGKVSAYSESLLKYSCLLLLLSSVMNVIP